MQFHIRNGSKPEVKSQAQVTFLPNGDYRQGWEEGRRNLFVEMRAEVHKAVPLFTGGLIAFGVLATVVGTLLGFVLGKYL